MAEGRPLSSPSFLHKRHRMKSHHVSPFPVEEILVEVTEVILTMLWYLGQALRIVELVCLEKTSMIIESNHQPKTTMVFRPRPKCPWCPCQVIKLSRDLSDFLCHQKFSKLFHPFSLCSLKWGYHNMKAAFPNKKNYFISMSTIPLCKCSSVHKQPHFAPCIFLLKT